MTGRHTSPIRILDAADQHVRNTRRAFFIVLIPLGLSVGALIAIILNKTGVL